MLHLAAEDPTTRIDPPAADLDRPLDPALLTFDPLFRGAIRASLLTGGPVDLPVQALEFPSDQARLPQFCERALSACPIRVDLSLLDGRCLRVSLKWVVSGGSARVSVLAADLAQEPRSEPGDSKTSPSEEVDSAPEKSPAEKQLRDSEERYRASFEQAAIGILHTSFDGRILRCNRKFGEMVGYLPEELAGLSFQEITPPGDRPPGDSMLHQLMSGALAHASFEKHYVRKDGSLTWVNLTITIQRDSEGRPLHFIAMAQDINARKQAEQQLALAQESLRKSEERYRTAFQMTMDAVALTRAEDGAYLDCNLAFQNLTGYAQDEVIGRTSVELGIWADPHDREKMLDLLKRNGTCSNFEVQLHKRNGEIALVMISASLIDLEGQPCILTVTRDLSEARMAENEIKRLAYYDPLTGLPNRRMLLESLRLALTVDRRSSRKRALLFVDLDNFKMLNDTLGHHCGDLLLQEVAHRLASSIRESDTAARIGGDEFVVMIENLSEAAEEAATQAKTIAEKICVRLAEPYQVARHECLSTASIGIAVFGYGKETATQILQQADIAMYQAKTAGRNAIRFFAPALCRPRSPRAPAWKTRSATVSAKISSCSGISPRWMAHASSARRRWCAGTIPAAASCRLPSSSP